MADDFWKRLKQEIHDLLRDKAILRSLSGRLYQISRLRRLSTDSVDDRGDPFFSDIEPEIYLAAEYSLRDRQNLEPLVMNVIKLGEFFDRFRADLTRSDSTFKAKTTSSAWHS